MHHLVFVVSREAADLPEAEVVAIGFLLRTEGELTSIRT